MLYRHARANPPNAPGMSCVMLLTHVLPTVGTGIFRTCLQYFRHKRKPACTNHCKVVFKNCIFAGDNQTTDIVFTLDDVDTSVRHIQPLLINS
jgi:hypothetical protein